MKVGFKVRIYPTKEQEKTLFEYCKVSHNMRNFLVSKYNNKLPKVNKYGIYGYKEKDLCNDFNTSINSRVARGVLQSYANSVTKFYKNQSFAPKFHKYNPNRQSFYIADLTWSVSGNWVPLPSNCKGKTSMSKRILIDSNYFLKNNITKIIELRFLYYNKKWFICGCYNKERVENKNINGFLGIDWGIKNFLTLSNGEFINYPNSVLIEYNRIKKLSHYLSFKKVDSNNYKKLLYKIRKAYIRMCNIKNDFIEKTTTELCKNNNISVEDLNNNKMIKNSRFIRKSNYLYPVSKFFNKLQWKCEKFGTYFVRVNPAYTSKTCSCCGSINYNLKLKDRVFKCECGNIMDRDVNAARNIAVKATCHSL